MSVSHPATQVVDAASGRLLYRNPLGDDAVGEPHRPVFRNYPGATPAARPERQPDKWLPLAPRAGRQLAHVYSDVNDDNAANADRRGAPRRERASTTRSPSSPRTSRAAREFKCSWNPAVPNSWRVNRAQNAAQMYYFLGTWHDHLAAEPIGFTRAAGNFEAVDGDAVQGRPDMTARTP